MAPRTFPMRFAVPTVSLLLACSACGGASTPAAVEPTPIASEPTPAAAASEAPGPLAAQPPPGGPRAALAPADVPAPLRPAPAPVERPAGVVRVLDGGRTYRFARRDGTAELLWRDGALLVARLERSALELRDARSGALRETIATGGAGNLVDGSLRRAQLAVGPRGRWHAVGCGPAKLFEGGELRHTIADPNARPAPEPREGGRMGAMAPSLEGHCVAFDDAGESAVIAFGRSVARVSLATGDITPLEDTGCRTRAVDLAADGSRFACASSWGARVFDAEGRELARFEADLDSGAGPTEALDLSADGRTLFLARDGQVLVLDVDAGRVRRRFAIGEDVEVHALAASADGAWVATAAAGRVDVWAVGSGRPIPTGAGHRFAVRTLVASPDGRRLASAGVDGRALLWDVARGEILTELVAAHRGEAAVAATPDGARWAAIASGREERPLRVVDAAGRLLFETSVYSGARGLALAADGRHAFLGHTSLSWLALEEGSRPRSMWRADDRPDQPERVFLAGDRLVVGGTDSTTLPHAIDPTCRRRCRATPLDAQPEPRRDMAEVREAVAYAMGRASSHDPDAGLHRGGLRAALRVGEHIVTLADAGSVYFFEPDGTHAGCWDARLAGLALHPSGRLVGLGTGGAFVLVPASPPGDDARAPVARGLGVLTGRRRECARLPEGARLELGHEGRPAAIAASTDRLFTAAHDGSIWVWEAAAVLGD